MNTLLSIFLGFQLTLGVPEIIISLIVAAALGFSIHFFLTSKKSMEIDHSGGTESISENDNWKLKYYNDMDMQERAQQQLRERLAEARENEQILTIELEETRKELDHFSALQEEGAAVKKQAVAPADYLSQLKSAQENLFEHNTNINRLLEQIEMLKESEKKYADSLKINEQLNGQLSDTRKTLSDKENEINQLRQQQRLNNEIAGRLDKAYSEFSVLQEKLQKLDKYLVQPHSSAEYSGLQESYFKLTKDFDDIKAKHSALWEENQRLSRILSDTEDKLREANFQRQQLQKKISFIEELNNDLQQVSEHNKKFESQLRRISEMEALLAKATQEKSDFHNEPGQ
jgi:DNA repair exonuclease SbcCD ATPase subunit